MIPPMSDHEAALWRKEMSVAATKTKRPTRKTVRCAYCGKRHRLRAAFVGYESRAICAGCEKRGACE